MPDDPRTSANGLSAFGHAEASLRKRLRRARVKAREFERKLSRCSLAECRGTCCYDGVSVDDDTAAVLERLSTERKADFAEVGLELPRAVVVESEWRGIVGKKTAVKPFPFRSLVADFPRHFNDTACVFLLADGRCGLQLIATNDGKHPWYYKPFGCWLHPIKLSASGIHLYDETTDPNRFPGYDGFACRTHCGRASECGSPAVELLEDEIKYLGKMLDRDLASEIRSEIATVESSQKGL
jgi:hypothetical protein